jgi:hypothetical protein
MLREYYTTKPQARFLMEFRRLKYVIILIVSRSGQLPPSGVLVRPQAGLN